MTPELAQRPVDKDAAWGHAKVHAPDLRQAGQAPLRWCRVAYGGREFLLRGELIIDVDGDEHGWVLESEALGIMGFGSSYQEAEDAFRHDFVRCWDHYALEDDSRLTKDAIALKRSLLSIVESCQGVQ